MKWRQPLDALVVVRSALRDAWDGLVAVAPLNIGWLGLALTVILLPPATAALFESMHELAAGRSPGFGDFLRSVRRRFVSAWLWALWASAGFTIVLLNVGSSVDPADPRAWLSAAVVGLGVLFFVSLLYVWPFMFLQADANLARAIVNSILTVLAAPLFAITIAILLALMVAIGAVLIVPLAIVVPGLIALVASHAVTDRLRSFGKLPPRAGLEEGD